LYNQVDISKTSVIDRLWFQGSMVVLVTSQNYQSKNDNVSTKWSLLWCGLI